MFKKLLIATAVVATSTSVAFAAHQGPYLGANVGMNNTKSTFSNSLHSNDMGSRGVLGGVFGGYGAIVSQNIYLGGEVFANYTNAEAQTKVNVSDVSLNYSLRNKYSYGISFIPGFMITPQTMAYGRIGVVRTRFEDTFNISAGSAGFSQSAKTTVTGGQLGAGIQTDLTQNLALRGEYVYTAYRSFNNGIGGSFKPNSGLANVGLVYNFG